MSFARRSRMARFTPFTEAMEMRSAWCDTNERREWGGYAVRSTPRALSLARKAVDLCNCRRREAAAECLMEKQVELVSFGEDPITTCTYLL